MEVLWNIDGGIMKKLRNLYGSFMEKIIGWNMEKLWRICEESQIWNICGESTHWKITDWKIPKRAKMERYAKPTGKVEKCFGRF